VQIDFRVRRKQKDLKKEAEYRE